MLGLVVQSFRGISMEARRRPFLALGVFAIWAAITAFLAKLWAKPSGHTALNESVSGAVQPSYIAAILFLLLCAGIFRWSDIGLSRPTPMSALRLLWFPGLYVTAFVFGVFALGLPPAATFAVIAVNTFLVGVSEELACRGILYQGFLERFGMRGAILLSTALFGVVHLLNGFTTGDFGAAALQSLTAFMSGIVFLAIRIRTGSLLPGMLLHGLWDCALVTLATTAAARTGAAAHDASVVSSPMALLPLLLILPNFLYGLYLLRKPLRGQGALGDRYRCFVPTPVHYF